MQNQNFNSLNFPANAQSAFRKPSPKKTLSLKPSTNQNIIKPIAMQAPILYLGYFNQILVQGQNPQMMPMSFQVNQHQQNQFQHQQSFTKENMLQLLRNSQSQSPPNDSTSESTEKKQSSSSQNLLQDLMNFSSQQSTQPSSSQVEEQASQIQPQTFSQSEKLLGKRKRKSERDLSYLRDELKKDFLWSRAKIEDISNHLRMSDTQVYKWWWDQTRKRQKYLSSQDKEFISNVGKQCLTQKSVSQTYQEDQDISQTLTDNSQNECSPQPMELQHHSKSKKDFEMICNGEFLIPSTDEFGGYSSRLRLHEVSNSSFSILKSGDENGLLNTQLEQNLCDLLGIDIEAMALAIVMEDKKKTNQTTSTETSCGSQVLQNSSQGSLEISQNPSQELNRVSQRLVR
eukprot:403352682